MDGSNAVRYILDNGIQGCFVECGVEKGKNELIWINELMKRGETRDIYLYDTFAGLPAPGEYDYTCENNGLFNMSKTETQEFWKQKVIDNTTNNWCYCPLEVVKQNLNSTGYPQERLHYIKGDVMETLKDDKNIPSNIAILRLDTDWYDSSKYELVRMYDKVVPGGLVIFDDYYLWDGQRRATDEFFASINLKPVFIRINDQTAAIIK